MTQSALSFLPGMTERLGIYVYVLSDPRPGGGIFYVGKGVGHRAYQHAAEARAFGETAEAAKLKTIDSIHKAGLEVQVEILRHQLTDDEAFLVEASVIDALRLAGFALTNKVAGRGRSRGWQSLEQLRALHGAQPITIDPAHRCVLIKINRMWRPGMTEEQLYSITREWWRLDPRRRTPDYVCAVLHGIVRAVYRIDTSVDVNGWQREAKPSKPTRPRWSFTGQVDATLDAAYRWRDVSAQQGKGQNPIRYVNC